VGHVACLNYVCYASKLVPKIEWFLKKGWAGREIPVGYVQRKTQRHFIRNSRRAVLRKPTATFHTNLSNQITSNMIAPTNHSDFHLFSVNLIAI